MSKVPVWMRLLRLYSLHAPFQRGTYRIALWLYHYLRVPDVEVETTLDRTLYVTLRLPIWVDYNIYCLGLYEAPLARFFIRSLRPDAWVLDIGAYIGQYTLLAAKYALYGQVIAFEPHPESFARLQAHVARNHLSNVLAFQEAVGEGKGMLPLVLSGQASDSALCPQSQAGMRSADAIEVKVTSLDEFVQEQGLPRVDLVKIDVEGAEGKVLRGAERILKEFCPLLIVEIDRSREAVWGDCPESIVAMLEKYGYALYILKGWHIRPFSRPVDYANLIAIPRRGL
ncbi:MAG: FkbM family methyltransferase [Anaerolineae bacterium]|nr:FkbM family methyltransferase [Anaerolineae bacterium]MDW8102177.1 FkbM family methyltransferase [Anaerolineae bacterium]